MPLLDLAWEGLEDMPQRVATRRRPRLAAVAVFVLLGMQALAVPVRAAAGIAVDVSTGDTQVHIGDVIKYVFTVTNTGDAVLTGGVPSGSLCDSAPAYVSGDTGDAGMLDPAETWLFDCPHEAVEIAHVIQNVANVTGIPPGGVPDVTATDTVDVEVLHPQISVEVHLNGPLLVGDLVRYSFGVLNPGDTPITQIVVVADICLTPIVPNGNGDGDAWIDIDGMEGWGYICDGPVVTAADTSFHADASVSGQDALGLSVEASGSGDAEVVHPAVSFTSTTKQTTAHPGDTITFTYKLENLGDYHIDILAVTNTECDEGTFKYGDDGIIFGLQVGKTWLGSCTHKVTEKVGSTVKNVYHFTGNGVKSFDLTIEASVRIVAKAVATTTPTAAPTEVPVEPSASVAPSVEVSAVPSAAPVTAPPVATPAPTAAPVPASSGGGLPILPILIVLVVVAIAGGGWFVWWRRRPPIGGGGDA